VVDLRYQFRLSDDVISELVIAPSFARKSTRQLEI